MDIGKRCDERKRTRARERFWQQTENARPPLLDHTSVVPYGKVFMAPAGERWPQKENGIGLLPTTAKRGLC